MAGSTTRLAVDPELRDPLVVAYTRANAATCAWRPIAWRWVAAGAAAALLGGTAAGAAGAPDAALGVRHPLLLAWFSHPVAVQGGLWGAAAAAALLGARRGARAVLGAPAGQEPWSGALPIALLHLGIYDPALAVAAVTAALCAVYLAAIIFRLLSVAAGGLSPVDAGAVEPAGGWPVYTVLVPLYREAAMAAPLLAGLRGLDYPSDRLDVKFLLEADDDETLAALTAAGIPDWAEVLVVPDAQPRTKPRACDHGLARARGALVVIFDAEDRPDPDQLKRAAAAFAVLPQRIVCLQARLAYRNARQNLLTRWCDLEYAQWFGRYLGGLVRLGMPVPLGGTSNHFRATILRDLAGWDPFNVTEDCDLGVRLHRAGWRTALLASTTWEEAPSRIGVWLRQRSRWMKGYLVTHLVWCRRPRALLAALGPRGAAGFVLGVGAVPAMAVANLMLWTNAVVYAVQVGRDLLAGFSLWEMLATRDYGDERHSWPMWFAGQFEDPLLAPLSRLLFLASATLLLGNLLFAFLAIATTRRHGRRDLLGAALLSPCYWVLISLGAVRGTWQLLLRPHYWEKTVHGLDRANP